MIEEKVLIGKTSKKLNASFFKTVLAKCPRFSRKKFMTSYPSHFSADSIYSLDLFHLHAIKPMRPELNKIMEDGSGTVAS